MSNVFSSFWILARLWTIWMPGGVWWSSSPDGISVLGYLRVCPILSILPKFQFLRFSITKCGCLFLNLWTVTYACAHISLRTSCKSIVIFFSLVVAAFSWVFSEICKKDMCIDVSACMWGRRQRDMIRRRRRRWWRRRRRSSSNRTRWKIVFLDVSSYPVLSIFYFHLLGFSLLWIFFILSLPLGFLFPSVFLPFLIVLLIFARQLGTDADAY